MDFFASQEQAEKRTRLMLVLFALAVAGVVLALDLLVGVIYVFDTVSHAASFGQAMAAVPAKLYWQTSAVVLAIIAAGTLYRLATLAGGGAAVAEMVGARRVRREGASSDELKLVNVVEEMAIAAGIRIPLIYVMDGQRGINAFAAGYAPDEAAVTVTQGALERLTRDELQGVVAHEFSHILNGDMRLNLRLIGVIAGLVFIGSIGRFLMRLGNGSDGDRIRGRGDVRLFLLGLVIWLIGSLGVLFGALIKAAISRQREFLADASAVQFTRNPEGIGGALFKIGQTGAGVVQLHADELSHMYFGAAAEDFFATHPPIDERIERLLGPGAAHLLERRLERETATAPESPASAVPEAFRSPLRPPADRTTNGHALAATPATLLAAVGNYSAEHVDYARQLIDGLPPEVRRAAATQAGAKAALYALLLDGGADVDVRRRQLELIAAADGQMTAEASAGLADQLKPQGVRIRMPLFSLVMATLRPVDAVEREAITGLVTDLVNADGKVTLAEFALLTLCKSQLSPPLQRAAQKPKYRAVREVAPAATTILSLLARTAQVAPDYYAKVIAGLGLGAAATAPAGAMTFQAVETALADLKLLAPMAKSVFVEACLEIVTADGRITVAEGELMRAVCAALEVPLPPVIEQPAAAD